RRPARAAYVGVDLHNDGTAVVGHWPDGEDWDRVVSTAGVPDASGHSIPARRERSPCPGSPRAPHGRPQHHRVPRPGEAHCPSLAALVTGPTRPHHTSTVPSIPWKTIAHERAKARDRAGSLRRASTMPPTSH